MPWLRNANIVVLFFIRKQTLHYWKLMITRVRITRQNVKRNATRILKARQMKMSRPLSKKKSLLVELQGTKWRAQADWALKVLMSDKTKSSIFQQGGSCSGSSQKSLYSLNLLHVCRTERIRRVSTRDDYVLSILTYGNIKVDLHPTCFRGDQDKKRLDDWERSIYVEHAGQILLSDCPTRSAFSFGRVYIQHFIL